MPVASARPDQNPKEMASQPPTRTRRSLANERTVVGSSRCLARAIHHHKSSKNPSIRPPIHPFALDNSESLRACSVQLFCSIKPACSVMHIARARPAHGSFRVESAGGVGVSVSPPHHPPEPHPHSTAQQRRALPDRRPQPPRATASTARQQPLVRSDSGTAPSTAQTGVAVVSSSSFVLLLGWGTVRARCRVRAVLAPVAPRFD